MRTDLNLAEPFEVDDAFVTDSDLIGFDRPRDIVHDPVLTRARKRQLLAYWGSDIHAVSGSPALRSIAYGRTASIDDIHEALCDLDKMVDFASINISSSNGVAA
jgi:hypothetical protein